MVIIVMQKVAFWSTFSKMNNGKEKRPLGRVYDQFGNPSIANDDHGRKKSTAYLKLSLHWKAKRLKDR